MKQNERLLYFQHLLEVIKKIYITVEVKDNWRRSSSQKETETTTTTTTMPAIDHEKVSRDDLIRARLLHTLGIQKPANRDPEKREHISVNNLLSNDAPIRRRLNDSKEEHNKKGHVRRLSRKRLVRFNSIVKEKPIASHKRYTDRIKRTMWSDTEEIQENAYRNQIEYQAEGMKWESVLEDDEMYMDARTGELIHPFWVESEDAKMLFS
jgi:hypothetical protein